MCMDSKKCTWNGGWQERKTKTKMTSLTCHVLHWKTQEDRETATNSFGFWLVFFLMFSPTLKRWSVQTKKIMFQTERQTGFLCVIRSITWWRHTAAVLDEWNAFLLPRDRACVTLIYMDMKWTRDKVLLLLLDVKHQHLLTEADRFESEKHFFTGWQTLLHHLVFPVKNS